MAFLPFDAMLYSEGLRRGYTPVQMAAAVGNRRAESGYNPLGAIGDTNLGPGQEAFGGFQWRLDRQQRLRQSGDVNNPQTHINHFFNELDSSEAKAGNMLRNAQTIAEANNAMKAYLRYGDDTLGKRQQYAMEAAQMFGNGQIPPELMMRANGGMNGSYGEQEDTRFFRPENFGNSLMRAGAALASINSPGQANAISNMVEPTGDDFMTSVNQQTGQIVRVNKRTGATQVMDAPALRQGIQQAAANDMAQYEQKLQLDKAYKTQNATDGFRKAADGFEREATGAAKMAERVANLSSAINSGEFTPDMMNRFKDTAFSILNMSPEARASMGLTPRQVELMSELERFKNTAALEDQLKQLGVQTDKDFLNNIKARFSSTDLYDPMKLRGALNETLRDFADRSKIASDNYIGRSAVFPTDASLNMPDRLGRMRDVGEKANKFLIDYKNNKETWANESAAMTRQQQQQAPAAPKWRLLP